jgi:DNA-directed RNA polymerase alpha subunit
MSDLNALADLLERAAKALRECQRLLPKEQKEDQSLILRTEISGRLFNVLRHAGINTWEQAASYSEDDFLSAKNVGECTVRELAKRLCERGLQFASLPESPCRLPTIG